MHTSYGVRYVVVLFAALGVAASCALPHDANEPEYGPLPVPEVNPGVCDGPYSPQPLAVWVEPAVVVIGHDERATIRVCYRKNEGTNAVSLDVTTTGGVVVESIDGWNITIRSVALREPPPQVHIAVVSGSLEWPLTVDVMPPAKGTLAIGDELRLPAYVSSVHEASDGRLFIVGEVQSVAGAHEEYIARVWVAERDGSIGDPFDIAFGLDTTASVGVSHEIAGSYLLGGRRRAWTFLPPGSTHDREVQSDTFFTLVDKAGVAQPPFGVEGWVWLPDRVSTRVLSPDDSEFFVSGSSRLMRMFNDGTFDESFGGDGSVEFPESVTFVEKRGDDYWVGVVGGRLGRIDHDGSFDPDFGDEGIAGEYVSWKMHPKGVTFCSDRIGLGVNEHETNGKAYVTFLDHAGRVDTSFAEDGFFHPQASDRSAHIDRIACESDVLVVEGRSTVSTDPTTDAHARYDFRYELAADGDVVSHDKELNDAPFAAWSITRDGMALRSRRVLTPKTRRGQTYLWWEPLAK